MFHVKRLNSNSVDIYLPFHLEMYPIKGYCHNYFTDWRREILYQDAYGFFLKKKIGQMCYFTSDARPDEGHFNL